MFHFHLRRQALATQRSRGRPHDQAAPKPNRAKGKVNYLEDREEAASPSVCIRQTRRGASPCAPFAGLAAGANMDWRAGPTGFLRKLTLAHFHWRQNYKDSRYPFRPTPPKRLSRPKTRPMGRELPVVIVHIVHKLAPPNPAKGLPWLPSTAERYACRHESPRPSGCHPPLLVAMTPKSRHESRPPRICALASYVYSHLPSCRARRRGPCEHPP